jgi:hypothetical protein
MAPNPATGLDGETVVVGSPNVPDYHSRVNARKYNSMKKVLIEIFPRKEPGVTQTEIMERVASRTSRQTFPAKTYMWWAKCVQLDMESKRELVRSKTAKPLRWWRV